MLCCTKIQCDRINLYREKTDTVKNRMIYSQVHQQYLAMVQCIQVHENEWPTTDSFSKYGPLGSYSTIWNAVKQSTLDKIAS